MFTIPKVRKIDAGIMVQLTLAKMTRNKLSEKMINNMASEIPLALLLCILSAIVTTLNNRFYHSPKISNAIRHQSPKVIAQGESLLIDISRNKY